MAECTAECRKSNKKINYVILSPLESSIITKSYELMVAVYDENMYLDQSPVRRYWKPDFLFQYIEEDFGALMSYLHKKVIRLKDFETAEVRRMYVLTGGDSSFIMNYEFHALGDGGILCGTDFVEYEPFPDAPEQVPVEEESGFAGLWGNILAGLAVVAAVSLAAAYLASLVFTAGASAAIAPMVVGGLAAAVGAAAVLGTAAKDAENGTNSVAASYIMNGLTGALTGARAGFELCLAPYAAETVIAASAPFGMSIFGQFVSAGALVDLTASGFFAITGANTLFKLTNAIEQVSGVNWMKSMGMSDESYSSYEEFSDLMSLQIGFWGMMNPRLWEKPKDPPGKITQSAGYQNPETYGYGHHYTKNKVKGRNCSI